MEAGEDCAQNGRWLPRHRGLMMGDAADAETQTRRRCPAAVPSRSFLASLALSIPRLVRSPRGLSERFPSLLLLPDASLLIRVSLLPFLSTSPCSPFRPPFLALVVLASLRFSLPSPHFLFAFCFSRPFSNRLHPHILHLSSPAEAAHRQPPTKPSVSFV